MSSKGLLFLLFGCATKNWETEDNGFCLAFLISYNNFSSQDTKVQFLHAEPKLHDSLCVFSLSISAASKRASEKISIHIILYSAVSL